MPERMEETHDDAVVEEIRRRAYLDGRFDERMDRMDRDLSAFERGIGDLNRDLEVLAGEARELAKEVDGWT